MRTHIALHLRLVAGEGNDDGEKEEVHVEGRDDADPGEVALGAAVVADGIAVSGADTGPDIEVAEESSRADHADEGQGGEDNEELEGVLLAGKHGVSAGSTNEEEVDADALDSGDGSEDEENGAENEPDGEGKEGDATVVVHTEGRGAAAEGRWRIFEENDK